MLEALIITQIFAVRARGAHRSSTGGMEITTPDAWSYSVFRHAALKHGARTKRLIQIGAALARAPAAPLPTVFPDAHQLKATYRFLANRSVTHAGILEAAVHDTVARSASHSKVLLLADTSELDYSHLSETRALGHIGDGRGRGMLFHTVLATTPDGDQVLGVIHQKVWIRRTFKNMCKQSTYARRRRTRESERWSQCARSAARCMRDALESPPAMVLVTDREGDIFSLYADCVEEELGFVIRVAQKHRALVRSGPEEAGRVWDAAVGAPVIATKEVEVPHGPGRAARRAQVEVRAAPVTLRPPDGLTTRYDAVATHVVLVREVNAPRGVEPLEWCLLTSEPIDTAEQVLAIVRMYESRWLLEEFHMGVKTGCGMETRQLQTGHGLRNLLAIVSPIACQLLRLRQSARAPSPPPASSLLSPTQLAVLRALRPKLPPEPTARDALRWIANLGGFLMRTRDGEPGWRTIWRGFQMLLIAEQGFVAGKEFG